MWVNVTDSAEYYYVTWIYKPLNQAYVEKTKVFRTKHEAFKFASRHNVNEEIKQTKDAPHKRNLIHTRAYVNHEIEQRSIKHRLAELRNAKSCQFCTLPYEVNEHGYSTNEIILESLWCIELRMGTDKYNNTYLVADGEDRCYYYPKFCPECGRRLRYKEDNDG